MKLLLVLVAALCQANAQFSNNGLLENFNSKVKDVLPKMEAHFNKKSDEWGSHNMLEEILKEMSQTDQSINEIFFGDPEIDVFIVEGDDDDEVEEHVENREEQANPDDQSSQKLESMRASLDTEVEDIHYYIADYIGDPEAAQQLTPAIHEALDQMCDDIAASWATGDPEGGAQAAGQTALDEIEEKIIRSGLPEAAQWNIMDKMYAAVQEAVNTTPSSSRGVSSGPSHATPEMSNAVSEVEDYVANYIGNPEAAKELSKELLVIFGTMNEETQAGHPEFARQNALMESQMLVEQSGLPRGAKFDIMDMLHSAVEKTANSGSLPSSSVPTFSNAPTFPVFPSQSPVFSSNVPFQGLSRF